MNQFTAHLDRGWDLVQRGDLAGALLSAQKGLELDAESPEAHNLIGYIQAAEGNAEEALTHYRQAIEFDETFVEAMLNAAEVLIHPLGDLDGALAMVEEALDYLDEDEERADALLLKFDVLLHRGDRDGATKVMRALPDGPFENPGLEFLIGRARFELGDVEGATPSIEAAVQRDPGHGDAQYYMGLIREARGDLRGATMAFLHAREADAARPPVSWSLPVDQFERRVQSVLGRLPDSLRGLLDGALVIVSDVPGAEVVADGVDPRSPLLFDRPEKSDSLETVSRVFVYQRNVERNVTGILDTEDALLRMFEEELSRLTKSSGD